MTNLLLFISILPSILLGKFIYDNDKVEKEPKSLLLLLFLLGILAIIITMIISLYGLLFIPYLFEDHNTIAGIIISYFIGVGLVEEFSKLLMVYVGSWNNNNFDYQYDGLIYSVYVSLGFATVENIMYVLGNSLKVAILRALLSVPGHVFFGIFMGYYYGLAKKEDRNNNKKKKKYYLIMALIIPAILHGIFDSTITIAFKYSDNYISDISILIYLLFIVSLYFVSFRRVKTIGKIKTNIDDELTRDIPMIKNRKVYCKQCGKLVVGNYCEECGTKK